MPGLPSFPFYPGDWMKDPALRQCSLQTRGAWIDLICFIHEHGQEGRIESTPVRLARYCGCLPNEMRACLIELREVGVCDVEMESESDDTGRVVIYSRRMHRDEVKREQNRERQKRFRSRSSEEDALCNAGSNARITPMSEREKEIEDTTSIVTEGKGGVGEKETTRAGPEPIPFDAFWDAYAKKVDRSKCERRWKKVPAAKRPEVIEHVRRYVALTPELRYRKNPLTYLNGECWNDELFDGTDAGGSGAPGAAVAGSNGKALHKYDPRGGARAGSADGSPRYTASERASQVSVTSNLRLLREHRARKDAPGDEPGEGRPPDGSRYAGGL